MYIQNATYKTIPTEGLTFPLEAGTVLTVNNITGIVPENVAVAAPTGVLYLAVGGTIDLTSEANAGITFTDAELNALSGDFNFIPLAESGGSSLPAFTHADKGKFLAIGDASPVETVIVPEQTWEQEEGTTLHDLAGVDWTGIEVGDNVVVTLNGNTFNATVQGNSSRYQILYGDSNQIVYVFSSGATKSSIVTIGTQTYTLSVSKNTASVEPKWEAVGLPEYTSADNGKFLGLGDGEPKWENVVGIAYNGSDTLGTSMTTALTAALTTFFSGSDTFWQDSYPNALTDDDAAAISAAANANAEGNTFIFRGLGYNFIPTVTGINSGSGQSVMQFIMPYYSQTVSSTTVIIRATFVMSSNKVMSVKAECVYKG